MHHKININTHSNNDKGCSDHNHTWNKGLFQYILMISSIVMFWARNVIIIIYYYYAKYITRNFTQSITLKPKFNRLSCNFNDILKYNLFFHSKLVLRPYLGYPILELIILISGHAEKSTTGAETSKKFSHLTFVIWETTRSI